LFMGNSSVFVPGLGHVGNYPSIIRENLWWGYSAAQRLRSTKPGKVALRAGLAPSSLAFAGGVMCLAQ